MIDYLGITDTIAFVGQGKTFQIWNPEDLQKHKEKSRNQLKKQGLTIKVTK
jgi:DNA-binding transcriptional regulator/RsmH inhibitor MraZ